MRNKLLAVYTVSRRGDYALISVTSQAGYANYLKEYDHKIDFEYWSAEVRTFIYKKMGTLI